MLNKDMVKSQFEEVGKIANRKETKILDGNKREKPQKLTKEIKQYLLSKRALTKKEINKNDFCIVQVEQPDVLVEGLRNELLKKYFAFAN